MNSTNPSVSESECAYMRLQRAAGVKYHNIADNSEVPIEDVATHVRGKCDCNVTDVEPIDDDSPWREPQVVKELFIEENMHFTEMANLLDCHPETARNWVIRFDVSPVPSNHRTSSKTVRLLQRIGAEELEEKGQNENETFVQNIPT